MNLQRTAVWNLTLCTAAWGLSFPVAKAVMQAQAALVPGAPEWFHAALILFNRMVIAVVAMFLFFGKKLRGLSRLELRQGIELGLFGACGMLLQTDAQNYMPASTSAFFTQFTSVFVPIFVAIRMRRMPSGLIISACLLVMAGCGILSGVKLGEVGFGRGEWETIASGLLFTGQILCLEQPRFLHNNPYRTATVMFAVKALVFSPVVFLGSVEGSAAIYASAPLMLCTVVLALLSTVFSYVAMNRWQPHVTATQAGIVYATEPIFAFGFALVLPQWLSLFMGLSYGNETLHWRIFVGGVLILLANALLILRPEKPPHGDPAPIG